VADSTASETAPKPSQPAQPHPSFIQVAKPYVFEQTIQECLAATGVDSSREDSIRIQGVTWIDNVRKALRL
jgi:CTD kinase subunit beta